MNLRVFSQKFEFNPPPLPLHPPLQLRTKELEQTYAIAGFGPNLVHYLGDELV